MAALNCIKVYFLLLYVDFRSSRHDRDIGSMSSLTHLSSLQLDRQPPLQFNFRQAISISHDGNKFPDRSLLRLLFLLSSVRSAAIHSGDQGTAD